MVRNGDTVFCIKDYTKNKTLFFKKGQRYIISECFKPNDEDEQYIDIQSYPFDDSSPPYGINTSFNLKKFSRKNMSGLCKICPVARRCTSMGAPYFSEHFISISEERRKKLAKLK